MSPFFSCLSHRADILVLPRKIGVVAARKVVVGNCVDSGGERSRRILKSAFVPHAEVPIILASRFVWRQKNTLSALPYSLGARELFTCIRIIALSSPGLSREFLSPRGVSCWLGKAGEIIFPRSKTGTENVSQTSSTLADISCTKKQCKVDGQ